MKKSLRIAVPATLFLCTALTPVALAATDSERAAAVQKGLAHLRETQQAGGFWNFSGDEQAATGTAAYAFLSAQDKWGDNTATYQIVVDRAIGYLVSSATTVTVGTRSDGVNVCPGGAVSCKGVYWFGSAKSTSTTGFVTPAIVAYGLKAGRDMVATTTGPLAGMTWGEIAQAITNVLAAAQSTSQDGIKAGGWGAYIPGTGDADSFDTQSAVVAFLYNETIGAITPAIVKNDLKAWLGNVQNSSGAVCYQPGIEPCDHAETGGWLLAMRFVGYDSTNPQVSTALDFLNSNWRVTANNVSHGNFAHPYAMWIIYNGLGTTIGLNDTVHISNFMTDCGSATKQPVANLSSPAPCTWSEDYGQWVLRNQRPDGGWEGFQYWTDPVAASFYINILGAVQIPLMAESSPRGGTAESKQVSPEKERSTSAIAPRQAGTVISLTAIPQGPQPALRPNKLRPRLRKGVTALALKGDGSAVASASTDKRVRVWNATTGQQTLVLSSPIGLPTGLAFAPNGNTLSSVGRDSLLRIWDTTNGTELARLSAHENAITSVATSPDGRYLATSGEETRVMLWDQTTRKLSKILFGATDFVNDVSFSPDSRTLATASDDARVLIFDISTGRVRYTLRGHSGPVDTVAFNPAGNILASGGQDTVIHFWDSATGQQRQALSGHQAPIRAITFSADGRLAASGGEDTKIILWNAANGTVNKILTGSTSAINSLAFDNAGRFLVSANDGGELILWNVTAGVKLRTIIVPKLF